VKVLKLSRRKELRGTKIVKKEIGFTIPHPEVVKESRMKNLSGTFLSVILRTKSTGEANKKLHFSVL